MIIKLIDTLRHIYVNPEPSKQLFSHNVSKRANKKQMVDNFHILRSKGTRQNILSATNPGEAAKRR